MLIRHAASGNKKQAFPATMLRSSLLYLSEATFRAMSISRRKPDMKRNQNMQHPLYAG